MMNDEDKTGSAEAKKSGRAEKEKKILVPWRLGGHFLKNNC
jgi:hypothetical protein